MTDFLSEQELSLEQAGNIARAMWMVAEVEHGVHQHEREMIEEFYRSACAEAGSGAVDLDSTPWDAAEARRLLTTDQEKELLISSCLLLGYADGHCSDAEKATIEQIAQQLGVTPERTLELDRDVKRVLLSPFEDIKVFRDAAYDIASKQLGLSAAEVDKLLSE